MPSLNRNTGRAFAGLLLVTALLDTRTAVAGDITACGETIASHDTGVLQADLDCSTFAYGVRLLSGATLDLNGHTIIGGTDTFATVLGVKHPTGNLDVGFGEGPPLGSGRAKFTVVGPGRITGAQLPDISGKPACILANDGRVDVTSPVGTVEIDGCSGGIVGGYGQVNHSLLTLDHVTIHDVHVGAAASRVKASNVTIDSARDGLVGKTVSATLVDVQNCSGVGLHAEGGRLQATQVAATGNGIGLLATSVQGTAVIATGNALYGVAGRTVRLRDSTVTGNANGDIRSDTYPRLTNTTCDVSRDPDFNPWGVCTND